MAKPEVSWSLLPDDLKKFAAEHEPGEPFDAERAGRFAAAGIEVIPAAQESSDGQPMHRFSHRFAWFLHRRSHHPQQPP